MKKLLIAAAVIFASMCIMAGCNTNEEPETITNPDSADVTMQEEASVEPASETETETEAAETTTAAPETTTVPETTTKAPETTTKAPETTTKAPVTTTKAPVTTTKAPVTTTKAPVTTTKAPVTTTKAAVSVNSVASKIASNSGMFEETLVKSSTQRGLQLFGISSANVEEAAYYAASAAVAEEVLVVKATSASAASTIVSNMESRRSTQIEDYADYVPKEVPKLQSAVVYQNGEYVVFCVSNNNSAIRSVITNQF